MKYGAPFFFRLEIDKKLGIEESRSIGPIIRTPHLTPALRNFREGTKNDARLVHHTDAFVGSGAGSQRAPHPKRAFIQMRKKFGTNCAPKSEETANDYHDQH